MSDFEKDKDLEQSDNNEMNTDNNITSDENNGEEANKDYDLDYFSTEPKEPKKTDEALQTDTSAEEDYNLELIFGAENEQESVPLEGTEPKEEAPKEFNLTSFGKTRKEIKKKNKKKPSKYIFKGLKVLGTVFVSIMLIGIITGCIVAGAFAIYVFNFVDDTVYEDLNDMQFTTTIYIKDKETGEYVEYQRLHAEENRIWVDLEDMPDNLKNAFVAVEDKRFNEHNGVDWKRTVSAFANMFVDLYSSNQGGSTITQQLVKNLTGDADQTPMRKIREIMRARYLESEYEKDTILECYLNTICLAGGMYGVEVAANYYFGKTVDELTLVECAAIASLAKEPEKYRPDKNPNDNQKRRNTVLYLMHEQGYISDAEYEEAKNAELTIVADPIVKNNDTVNSYFIDTLIDEVTDKLVEEYGFDETYAAKNFYNGGYKIYCTLDPEIQGILDDEYSKTDTYFKLKSKKNPGETVQSAMTIMDYEGHIVGLIGGAGDKTENRGFNRATMAYRHPGSTMKPLASYSQALQKNLITYSSIIEDSALDNYYAAGKPGPKNWYSGYKGDMMTYKALEMSVNTIPCKLVKQMGVETTYYYLYDKLHFTSLDSRRDMNLSALGLGGTNTGITTTQSAAAFAIFGNLGVYYEPTTFTHMTDQKGNVILEQEDGNVVLDENTACIMNHMLQNVVYGKDGTGTRIKSFSKTMKCYAKTGTSSDTYDSWLAGGTPYYVASCWFGFDEQEKLNDANLAKNMWREVMKRIHKDLEPKEFEESSYVTRRYFCKETGLLATSGCTELEVGYYKTNYSLPQGCTTHEGEIWGVVTDEWIENGGPIVEEPEEPENPETPEIPEQPETPDEPQNPTTPETPTVPETPDDEDEENGGNGDGGNGEVT